METGTLATILTNTWGIVLVVLFFGGSIFVHELGHFLAARRRGLRVERFSIGFGPRLWTWHKDGVEYCISLIPLGGYVALPELAPMPAIEGKIKLPGGKDPQDISFSTKFIVFVMGAVFNVLFAFVLACITWVVGIPGPKMLQTTEIGYVAETLMTDTAEKKAGPAYLAGIRPGDTILAIDGSEVDDFQDVLSLVAMGEGRDAQGNPECLLEIQRNGERMAIAVKPELVEINAVSGDQMRMIGVSPAETLNIAQVMEGAPAEDAGLKAGDQIVSVDGTRVYGILQLFDLLEATQGRAAQVEIQRDGVSEIVEVAPDIIQTTKPLLTLNTPEGTVDVLPVFAELPGSTQAMQIEPAELTLFSKLSENAMGQARRGDTLVKVNGQKVHTLNGVVSLIGKHAGSDITLELKNAEGGAFNVSYPAGSLSAKITAPKTRTMLGVVFQPEQILRHPNPIAQFVDITVTTFRTLSSLLSPSSDISVQHLSAAPGIARVIHQFSMQDIRLVLWLVTLLNINLAILNLLPIPVLDGGHILFAVIEKIRGKALPSKSVQSIQGAFMLMLLGLMLYVTAFDIQRWRGDAQSEDDRVLEQELYLPVEFGSKDAE